MRNAKKMENEVSKRKIEKVKPDERNDVPSAIVTKEKSVMFLNNDGIESRSSHHLLESNQL